MANEPRQTPPYDDELDSRRFASVLSENLKYLFESTGFHNRSLISRMTGISRGKLYKIERAKANPRLSDIVKIADIYGVTPAELITPREEAPIEFESGHATFSS